MFWSADKNSKMLREWNSQIGIPASALVDGILLMPQAAGWNLLVRKNKIFLILPPPGNGNHKYPALLMHQNPNDLQGQNSGQVTNPAPISLSKYLICHLLINWVAGMFSKVPRKVPGPFRRFEIQGSAAFGSGFQGNISRWILIHSGKNELCFYRQGGLGRALKISSWLLLWFSSWTKFHLFRNWAWPGIFFPCAGTESVWFYLQYLLKVCNNSSIF